MRSQRRAALERDKFSKEKAKASLLTMEIGRGRRAKKESGVRRELEGAGVPEAIDMRWGPPQFCPVGLPNGDPSAWPGSGQGTEVLGGRVSAPAGRGRMEGGNGKALGGEPKAGNEIGALSPQAKFIRVQDLPSLGIVWPGHGSGI